MNAFATGNNIAICGEKWVLITVNSHKGVLLTLSKLLSGIISNVSQLKLVKRARSRKCIMYRQGNKLDVENMS